MTPRTLATGRRRFWKWLTRFERAHPGMTLPGMLAFALDAGVCSREERDALLRAAGVR